MSIANLAAEALRFGDLLWGRWHGGEKNTSRHWAKTNKTKELGLQAFGRLSQGVCISQRVQMGDWIRGWLDLQKWGAPFSPQILPKPL